MGVPGLEYTCENKWKNVGETLTGNSACLLDNICSVIYLFIDAGALHMVLSYPFLYLIPICPLRFCSEFTSFKKPPP